MGCLAVTGHRGGIHMCTLVSVSSSAMVAGRIQKVLEIPANMQKPSRNISKLCESSKKQEQAPKTSKKKQQPPAWGGHHKQVASISKPLRNDRKRPQASKK